MHFDFGAEVTSPSYTSTLEAAERQAADEPEDVSYPTPLSRRISTPTTVEEIYRY